MTTFLQDLKLFTKTAIGAIIALATAMQFDPVKNYVTPLLANHPKITSVFMAVVGLGLLLSRPEVQRILGYEDLVKMVKKAQVSIDEEKKLETNPKQGEV